MPTRPPAALSAQGALGEDHRSDLRCAAAFAIAASAQAAGAALDGWPPLALRGRTFFADTGERVMRETGLTREAVRELMTAEVRALQTAPDPDAALADMARPCVARLDATVAPLERPSLAQCAAIFDLAQAELAEREGLSPAVRDLMTLGAVLSARAREAVAAGGGSGTAADRQLAETREALAAEAARAPGALERYDIARCYDLAKPEARSHY